MRGARRWPLLLAVTVLGLTLVITLWPAGSSTPVQGQPASLPARLANYSYLTGDVSASPPGRAMALFQHGFGVEFMDFPQAVMVGADADLYRRLGAAEARGGFETQGDPGPLLLSPDGTQVAVGDYDMRQPDVALLDLHSGKVHEHAVTGGHSVIPLAWSPDSSRLAYLSTAEPVDPYVDAAIRGDIGIFDVATGEARLLPGAADARTAAFSPDGTELAVHRIPVKRDSQGRVDEFPRRGGGAVNVVGLDGAVDRQLPLPPEQYLDGPNAWSPDGALLATAAQSWGCQPSSEEWDEAEWDRCIDEADATFFVDASGRGAPVPATLKAGLAGGHGVLGWTREGEVVVLDDVQDSNETATDDTTMRWLTAVPLDGGPPRRLTAVPLDENYGIGDFQLAVALLPGTQVREAGPVDRGRLPTPLRVAAAVLIAGAVLLIGKSVSRRRQSRPASQ